MESSNLSICHWMEGAEGNNCGYCKNSNCSYSNGMWGEQLLCSDYQHLIDRGWRRSGKYLYKPKMDQTCCPAYAIRCDTTAFKLSKSQKKVVKKFNKFLHDGVLKFNDSRDCLEETGDTEMAILPHTNKPDFDVSEVSNALVEESASNSSHNVSFELVPSFNQPENHTEEISTKKESTTETARSESSKFSHQVKRGDGADPNRPPCMKAKKMRLERKLKKLESAGKEMLQVDPVQGKTLEEFLNDIPDKAKHKITMKLVSTSKPDRNWQISEPIEFALYKKYQITVHDDKPQKVNLQSFHNFLVSTPLQIKFERMSASSKEYKESYQLFVKYQIAIHEEKVADLDEESFDEFLIDTPLKYEPFNDQDDIGYGSYHQQYWLDNKLIAVGVIDILPKCVSSVYFFYDPDYRALTLGTYGSLREVEFARSLSVKNERLKYYYLGFYIHSCPKMRYKSKMAPSFLLCPESFKFESIEKCLKKLDAKKYSRLADDSVEDSSICSRNDLKKLKLFVRNRIARYTSFSSQSEEAEQIRLMGKLIGRKCVPTMLVITNF